MGDEMITLDPALDQKKQNEQIKQLVKRKVDAIFLNSVDWKEVESGLEGSEESEDSCDRYRLTGLQK